MTYRTIVQAIEDAASAPPTLGLRFIAGTGVPGFAPRPAALPGAAASGALPSGAQMASADLASEASFSYTAIERASARYGGALQALGLRKGDRVALILPTNEDFILTFFGAMRAGIIPVPIYPPLGLGQLQQYLDNTRHVVAKCGAKALVTSAKIKRLLGTVQEACPELAQVVAVEAIRDSLEPLRAERIGLDDVAFLQFTSGSTSRPKGVTLTHGNLAANIDCIMAQGLRIGPEDVGISWLPLYHDMGLIGFVLAPLYHRVPIVYLEPLLFLKRPIAWFQAFTRHKGTIAYAPNFAYALCVKRIRESELSGIDLSHWRVAGCGAEPIRPETLEAFAQAFERVGFRKEALLPSYGMAESSLAVTFSELDHGMRARAYAGPTLWSEGVAKPCEETDPDAVRLVACGRQFEGHSVRVFEESDEASERPLPDRCVGEIRIQGPSVMTHYWDDSDKTRATFAGPYLRTGDLGFLDDGELYICGRSKEVIILNGRNYYPQDIEWEASKVSGVRKGNVIAFGARDPSGHERDRERVVVALEVQDEAALARATAIAAEVRSAVQAGIGLTLDDTVVLRAGTLPKTSSGKLQRAKTRELYEAGELAVRAPARDAKRVDLLKEAAKSQLSYFKLAVLGARRPKT